MKLWASAFFAVAIVVIASFAGLAASGDPDAARWWSHILTLADDSLEGRDTGSEGHRKAAAYVAREFEKAGLKPAGTNGYLEPVTFKTRTIDEEHSSLALVRENGTEALKLGEDANISLRVDPVPSLEAGLVFAGYGLKIPEAHHDDFQGLDVRGKVVVYLAGPPPGVPGPLAAHMQSAKERTAVLNRLGAVGAAAITNPKNMDIPWARATLARFLPSMSLADPTLDDTAGQKIAIAINPAHADRWFEGTHHTIKEILEAADSGKPLPHFEIPAHLKVTAAVKRTTIESWNVVALLPGNDPKLQDESVVMTAHLDHLGIGKPIHGDAIYNGAMDNASGIATLLEVAAALKESGTKLHRPVLFVAVTGEEKGLLGSRFFANNFRFANGRIVADLNVDMFLPLFPLKRLTIYGLDESDLGDDAAAVAKSLGISPEADPEPKRNLFIRSDQYSFIRQGVPSVALKVGFAKGSPEEKTAKAWLSERYHAPSDDVKQPVDKKAAAEFNALVVKLLERVANREQRPRWKDSSFFKRFAEN